MSKYCDCPARLSNALNLIIHTPTCSIYKKTHSPITQILEQRETEYGSAEDNWQAVGRIWAADKQIEDIPAHEVGLMMAQWKIQRLFANPTHEDSWNDLLGYLHHAKEIAMKGSE